VSCLKRFWFHPVALGLPDSGEQTRAADIGTRDPWLSRTRRRGRYKKEERDSAGGTEPGLANKRRNVGAGCAGEDFHGKRQTLGRGRRPALQISGSALQNFEAARLAPCRQKPCFNRGLAMKANGSGYRAGTIRQRAFHLSTR
jgi:hypothetical protein